MQRKDYLNKYIEKLTIKEFRNIIFYRKSKFLIYIYDVDNEYIENIKEFLKQQDTEFQLLLVSQSKYNISSLLIISNIDIYNLLIFLKKKYVEELEIVRYKSDLNLHKISDLLKENKSLVDIIGNNDSVFYVNNIKGVISYFEK